MKLAFYSKYKLKTPFKHKRYSPLSYMYLMGHKPYKNFIGNTSKFFFRLLFFLFFPILKKTKGKFIFSENIDIKYNSSNTQFSGIYLPQCKYYEPETSVLIDKLIENDDIFYDIGSNWGHYALHLGSNKLFTGQIFAFEPHPESFKDLKDIISQANLTHMINCYEIAISDSNGDANIFLPDKIHSGTATISNSKSGIKIQQRKIDDLDLPSPTFIKMDVEGFEYQALKGAKNKIEKIKPIIIFESHKRIPETFKPFDFLKEAGYVFYYPIFFEFYNGYPIYHGIQNIITETESNLGLWEFDIEERCFLPPLINILACHKDMVYKIKNKFETNGLEHTLFSS